MRAGGAFGAGDEVERGEGVIRVRAGLELEALVVELFQRFENLRNLGAVGPAVELED